MRILTILFFGIQTALSQPIDTLYYADGSVKAFGRLTNEGTKQGHWIYQYPSGQLNARMNFKDGLLSGIQTYYDLDENVIACEHWEMDLLQDSSFYYHSNGQVEKKGLYVDGLYQGMWVFYYENGNLKRKGNYEQGLPQQFWQFYFENGKLNQEGVLKNGKEVGLWKYYNEKGEPTYEGKWENGVKIGQWFYYKNGKRKPWKKFN